MQIRNFNILGINSYTNPLVPANNDYASVYGLSQINQGVQDDGILIRAVNVDSQPQGAKQKRPGYGTFLSNSDGSQVNSLFSWQKDNGTSIYLYRASGSLLYYYDEGAGTGDWTICGNGTITAGSNVTNAVLGNTLIISDGGTTRHTTTGTSFTDTTLAPPAIDLVQYQNRIYAAGTSSTLFYSTANDATNWNTSGTSDSSSLQIPDAGRLLRIFKLGGNLIASKSSGKMFIWDGYNLIDMSTTLGLTSAQSFAKVENYGFWLNRNGFFYSSGGVSQLISNPIQRYIYNNQSTGIAGTTFDNAPSAIHRYDYLTSVGSIRDDFTNEPLNNAIAKYSYQKNEWLFYQFNNLPTSFTSYKDRSGNQQLIFGDGTGQTYKYGGTYTDDNGQSIQSVMELVYHLNYPHIDKEFRWIWLFFNPGCQAKIQVAITDAFSRPSKKWVDVGDVSTGVVKFRFPPGSKGKFLFLKIYEASRNTPFTYYGCAIDANLNPQI